MEPDDYLQMSGIQHFCFCRRQWALIHLEQLWSENLRTTEGRLMHERVHDESLTEKRGDLLIIRGMRVVSHQLRLSGSCDAVEFNCTESGILLQGRDGLWLPHPVEYKHGHSKEIDADRLQLCAQAIALEEMLVCEVKTGAIFYMETHRREQVEFTADLRDKTQKTAFEMVKYFDRQYTPKVKPGKHCNACSLKDLCLPKLCTKLDAKKYLKKYLEEDVLP